jgi:hypothetical protein
MKGFNFPSALFEWLLWSFFIAITLFGVPWIFPSASLIEHLVYP